MAPTIHFGSHRKVAVILDSFLCLKTYAQTVIGPIASSSQTLHICMCCSMVLYATISSLSPIALDFYSCPPKLILYTAAKVILPSYDEIISLHCSQPSNNFWQLKKRIWISHPGFWGKCSLLGERFMRRPFLKQQLPPASITLSGFAFPLRTYYYLTWSWVLSWLFVFLSPPPEYYLLVGRGFEDLLQSCICSIYKSVWCKIEWILHQNACTQFCTQWVLVKWMNEISK